METILLIYLIVLLLISTWYTHHLSAHQEWIEPWGWNQRWGWVWVGSSRSKAVGLFPSSTSCLAHKIRRGTCGQEARWCTAGIAFSPASHRSHAAGEIQILSIHFTLRLGRQTQHLKFTPLVLCIFMNYIQIVKYSVDGGSSHTQSLAILSVSTLNTHHTCLYSVTLILSFASITAFLWVICWLWCPQQENMEPRQEQVVCRGLTLYGCLLMDSRTRNPQSIIRDYFMRAVTMLEGSKGQYYTILWSQVSLFYGRDIFWGSAKSHCSQVQFA